METLEAARELRTSQEVIHPLFDNVRLDSSAVELPCCALNNAGA